MSVRDTIEQFILEQLAAGERRERIDPDESLITTGILDSMALLRLVLWLEQRLGVNVGNGDLTPANFETVNQIERFVLANGPAR